MSVAASRYARALIDVLYPAGAESGLTQLQGFAALLQRETELRRIFENPTVSSERRKALLKEVADRMGFETHIRNFLDLLVERNRLDLIDAIIPAYQTLYDERQGVVRAQVRTARPLDTAAQKEVAAKLQTMTGKQVRMEVSVDPSLLGGLVAQVGSTIYDGSLRQQLKAFKERLVND